jgi:hypothetical protein
VRFQREAFGMADRLVAVSSRDQATLCDVGLRAEVAPNPADSRLFDLDRLPEPRHIVAEQYGLRLPAGRICLFVGSLHEPNVIAAARIRELARRMHGMAEAANIGFVIAGGCAPPGRDGNLLALGRVDDALLLALYAFADLVPIPLPFGTGHLTGDDRGDGRRQGGARYGYGIPGAGGEIGDGSGDRGRSGPLSGTDRRAARR